MNVSKNHLLKSILIVFLCILPFSSNSAFAQMFKDVPSTNVHAKDIERLTKLNVISGYGNGYYGIDDSIRRDHAVLLIYKILKDELEPKLTYPGFKDVPKSYAFYEQIKWGYETGVINGMGDGKFAPTEFITREQMAVILVNAFNLKTNSKATIKDVSESKWSYKFVNILQANEITFLTNGNFNPSERTTRGQMASFLVRAVDKTGVEIPVPETPTKPDEPIEEVKYYDSGYDMKWTVEEGTKTLVMKGYSNGQLVGEYVKGAGQSLQGITIGMTRQQVATAKVGKFTNVIRYKDGRYRVETETDPLKMKQRIIFEDNGQIVSVFLDNYQNDKVVGILAIDKEKYAEKPYYYPYSASLQESYEQLMVILMNQSRKEFNKSLLSYTPEWNFIARGHSKDMINRNYFDHNSPDGKTLKDRFVNGNLKYTFGAENISYGYETVIHAHEGFMNSSGHRNNILHDTPNKVFVGAEFSNKSDNLNTVYYTVNFFK